MKLKVVSKHEYRSREKVYKPGHVFEVSEEEGQFLMRDAPGCFEDLGAKATAPKAKGKAKGKAVEAPPADKAVKGEAKK